MAAQTFANKVTQRSTTRTLLLAGSDQDPLVRFSVSAVGAWARAIWDKQFDRRVLAVSFDAALRQLRSKGPSHLAGRGPASATVLALHRAGWSARNAVCW
eukprot:6820462-Alexandrium_andersonii.AAC.1